MSAAERLERHWANWASVLDAAMLRSANSPRSVVAVGVFMAAFVTAGSSPSLLGPYLAARAVPFAIAVAPAWLLTLTIAAYCARHEYVRWFAALSVVVATLVAYEAGCLLSFSGASAAPALAGLVALTCVAHGHQGRASIAHPYVALADAVGLVVAALHAPTDTHRAFLALGGVSGIVAGTVVGTSAFESQRARTRADAMRNAVQAGIAAERFAKTAELEGIVLDARARSHDEGNALMAALLTVEILAETLDEKDARLAEDVSSARDALKTALGLSKRGHSSGGGPHGEPVAIATALEPIAHAARARHAGVCFELARVDPDLVAYVEEGGLGFRRIVENLLVNAAEGDGTRGARRVEVRAEREADSDMILIEVVDDGPGFAAAQLADDVEAFGTTKVLGTGLGLFTAERLARASGGWMQRRNGTPVGAVVTVVLPSAIGRSDVEVAT